MSYEKLYEVIKHEGVVAIVSSGNDGPHIVNTWNSYVVIENNKMFIPAGGMRKTQKNIEQNNRVLVTLGSKEVMGYKHMGAGFLISGSANFLESGSEFDMMKEKFPFLSRVLEITFETVKQTI